MDEGDHAFDDQNSIGASIVDDLEPSDRSTRSPLFGIPSIPSHHSGFRSEVASDRDAESEDSSGPWSPPAWRRAGAGWFKQPPEEEHAENDDAPSRLAQKSRSRSRDTSPSYESAGEGDVTLPARGPLISPTPRRTPVRGTEDAGQRPKTEARNGASSEIAAKSEPPPRQDKQKRQGEKNGQSTNPNNCKSRKYLYLPHHWIHS